LAQPVPALILLPPAGVSPAEHWVAQGRTAAARDLVTRLLASRRIGPVHVAAAEPDDLAALRAMGAVPWEGPPGPFHFGTTLGRFIEATGVDALAYFGGASAPLLTDDLIVQSLDLLASSDGPAAVVNNVHSTDWGFIRQPQGLCDLTEKLSSDNPIGWVLGQEAGYAVLGLPPSAATRADLDTPADFLLLSGHPQLGPALVAFLQQAPPHLQQRIRTIRQVLRTPASHVTIIGRSSSHLWQSLERRGQIWVRLLVEERGMVASGRLERHEVRSIVGEMLEAWGPDDFVQRLTAMSDAVLWDTRVWMAHRGGWPSVADRFSADLGWTEQIEDQPLADLTRAIEQAPIPILTGGHGVVAGSIHALVETLGPD
jgi:hypothetical protein